MTEQHAHWNLCSTNRRKFLFAFLLADILVFCIYYGNNASIFATTIFLQEEAVPRGLNASRGHDLITRTNTDGHRNGTAFYQIIGGADVHAEHPLLGHTWADGEAVRAVIDPRDIAMGLGITTKSRKPKNSISAYPFFKSFLPSFCKTASQEYNYNFYLAYDHNDPKLTKQDFADQWAKQYTDYVLKNCPSKSNYSIHFVKCSHSKSPAWAQNDAMIEAYFNNMAYYYRINDDTVLKAKGWTEGFIAQLGKYEPKNVGVVGPKHSGGNMAILTYDFVHITHVDIFGFYYPRVFPHWYGDRWITDVYKPGRTTKMSQFPIAHTMEDGQRYHNIRVSAPNVHAAIENGKQVLNRYIQALESNHLKPKGDRVISLGLWGMDPKYTFGAVRNAQLVPILFPEWKLRVYISDKDTLKVPVKVVSKLGLLGAEVVYINKTWEALPPERWRLLVALDTKVTHFLIRDADSRLSEREAAVVGEWLTSGKPFHCVRDNKAHTEQAVVDGLWGGISSDLSKLLTTPWDQIINASSAAALQKISKSDAHFKDPVTAKDILTSFVWDKVKDDSYCHDSVSCDKWPNAVKFPVKRTETTFLGQSFGPFGMASKEDIASAKAIADDKCVKG